MSTSRENDYIKEYDELRRVISVISTENCPLVHKMLSKKLSEIESHLDQVTDPNYLTLHEILAKKFAEAGRTRPARVKC